MHANGQLLVPVVPFAARSLDRPDCVVSPVQYDAKQQRAKRDQGNQEMISSNDINKLHVEIDLIVSWFLLSLPLHGG